MRLLSFALILLAGLSACSAWRVDPVAVAVLKTETTAGAKQIVVIKSGPFVQYDGPIEQFTPLVRASVKQYTLTDYVDDDIVAELIEADNAGLLYVLGSRAALFARKRFPHTATLFAMVLNHHQLGLDSLESFMGISLEPPAYTQFSQFKLVTQDIHKVAVFYNPDSSSETVLQAQREVTALGVELVAVPVRNSAELVAVFDSKIEQVDSVWLLTDQVVMNPESFGFLREATIRKGKYLMASYSDAFARGGALMAMSVDLSLIGGQASAMANAVLDGTKRPVDFGVVPPIGGKLFVNTAVAEVLKVTIPDELLPLFESVGSDPHASNEARP